MLQSFLEIAPGPATKFSKGYPLPPPKGKGRPRVAVALALNRLIAGQTVYSDGWAVGRPWISSLFAEAGIRQEFSVSPLERILTQA